MIFGNVTVFVIYKEISTWKNNFAWIKSRTPHLVTRDTDTFADEQKVNNNVNQICRNTGHCCKHMNLNSEMSETRNSYYTQTFDM